MQIVKQQILSKISKMTELSEKVVGHLKYVSDLSKDSKVLDETHQPIVR